MREEEVVAVRKRSREVIEVFGLLMSLMMGCCGLGGKGERRGRGKGGSPLVTADGASPKVALPSLLAAFVSLGSEKRLRYRETKEATTDSH